MKKIALLALILSLTGCAYRELNYGGATYRSYTLFLKNNINDIKMSYTSNSLPILSIQGFNQDQTKALQTLNLALEAYLKTIAPIP